ncbi:DUF255 domain-containing protein [Paenarthrobacter sp. YJN-5]|nr:DUF255 domain-containing protein [Paenarthrobacter sp. YJN-5]
MLVELYGATAVVGAEYNGRTPCASILRIGYSSCHWCHVMALLQDFGVASLAGEKRCGPMRAEFDAMGRVGDG